MPARFYWESDGGGWWERDRHIIQPRTYYVIDRETDERIDCQTKAEARDLAASLNRRVFPPLV